MKYDISVNPKEIIESLKNSSNAGDSIVWQTFEGHRNIYQVKDIEIDELRSLVKFSFNEDDIEIDEKQNIYIKLSHRNTIFKGPLLDITSGNVVISIPEEIQLEEFREFARYTFSFEEKRTATVTLKSNLMTKSRNKMKFQILDIAQKGLGLISSIQNKELILKSSEIYLTHLGDYELPLESKLTIRHFNDIRFRSEGKYIDVFKIGVELDIKLSEELIDNFIKRIEGRHVDEIGFLSINDQVKTTIYDEMSKMFTSLRKQSSFSSIIKKTKENNFDRENYLDDHCNLLARISCGISYELGIFDKNTVRDLVYVAYTHDIAFTNNPKLAFIKNTNHFKKVKDKLSMDEQLLFKKALLYFEEFTNNESSGPARSIEIVKSFYRMRNKKVIVYSSEYSITSCIFAVSHHLVDYILLRKEWSYYDYLKEYRKVFKEGTFDLIYDALDTARIVSNN